MSAQVIHSLKQVAILVVIAAVVIIGEQATGVMEAAGVDKVWWPIVVTGIASFLRWLEGIRDANRASIGKVQSSDVAFSFVKDVAIDPVATLESLPVPVGDKTVYVDAS